MIEILWIGRGGQGAFTAAKLLGAAYISTNNQHYALAFPSFGPERRGAPVRAFTKLDDKPILNRSQSKKVDYIVILDETLYSEELHTLLQEYGKIIVNSKVLEGKDVISFNGETIAADLHLPTVNTVMLGELAGVSGVVSIDEIFEAIDQYMPEKIRSKNKEAVLRAYEGVNE